MCDQFQTYCDAMQDCGFYLYRAHSYPRSFSPNYGVTIGRGQYLYHAIGDSLVDALTKAMRKAESGERVVKTEKRSNKDFDELMTLLDGLS